MNLDDTLQRSQDFIERYLQVFGALMTLLEDQEYSSAGENVIELVRLLKTEVEFWETLERTLIGK